MTKTQAIRQVNGSIRSKRLNTQNTHWSNIVEYRAEEGWWLKIPFHKFSQELNVRSRMITYSFRKALGLF